MKTTLLLAAVLLAAEPTAPTIEKAEIIDPGIYTASVIEAKRDEKGILQSSLGEVVLSKKTRKVTAAIGTRFGFRFRLHGTPKGAAVTVKKVTTFPAPGLLQPGAAEKLAASEKMLTRTLGAEEATYTGYAFDDAWELVPGTWKIELFDGDRKLASEEFKVSLPSPRSKGSPAAQP